MRLLLASLVLNMALAYSAQSENWTVKWDERQAVAKSTTGKVLTLYSPPEVCASGEKSILKGAVVAIAGRYVSTYTNTQDNCFAGPNVVLAFSTLDLDQRGKPVSLLDLFTEKQVYQALMNDKFVAKVIAGQTRPTTLDGLFALYNRGKSGCTTLERETLTNFALYALQGNQVAVRLGLPYLPSIDNCTWGLDQLGLLLPVPERLRAPLQEAQQNGTLMVKLKGKTNLVR